MCVRVRVRVCVCVCVSDWFGMLGRNECVCEIGVAGLGMGVVPPHRSLAHSDDDSAADGCLGVLVSNVLSCFC